MNSQKAARVTGALFIITFITSIPALLLYHPVLHDTKYIIGSGSDTQVAFGAVLELLLIVANIGSAVALYPVLKRKQKTLSLSYVTARITESAFIAVGIVSLLTIVTLRRAGAGTDTTSFIAIGKSLVAIHNWTFVLGPGFIVGIGNGMILGYMMYKTELVPKQMAMFGLVGGPLIIITGLAVVMNIIDRGGKIQGIATAPEFIWELSFGIYLLVKGFRPSALTELENEALVQ